MAIAFDTSNYLNFTATSGTLSYTCTGTNRLLLVFTENQGGADDVTGVTYNGNAMTQFGTGIVMSGTVTLRGWYMFDSGMPASGVAANIVISRSTSNDTWNIAVSYNGVKQSGFPDASSFFNDSTSPYTGTVTTIADNCWTVLMGNTSSSGTQTASTGSTFRRNNTSGLFQLYDSNGAITPAGSTSMSYTSGVNEASGNIMVSFAPTVTQLSISVSDQLNITESVAMTLVQNISVSDQLNITESVTMLETSFISVSDQLNVTESVTLEVNNFISVSDQLNVTESVTIFINPLFISVSDQLNVTESVTIALFQETLTLSVSDQLNITENIQTGLDNYISVNDQLTITESVSTSVQNNVSVSDQLNVTEFVTPGLTSFISVSDQLDITESVTKTVSEPTKGLTYMRGSDQNLPVTLTKQDYPLGFNDTSVS